MVDAISISISSLKTNAVRAGVAANNIANMGSGGAVTPGPRDRTPYTPQDVVAIADPLGGVQARVVDRDPATVRVYDPGSVDANADGLVALPNVDLATESVNLMTARAAYAASAAVIRVAGDMRDDLLSMVDRRV